MAQGCFTAALVFLEPMKTSIYIDGFNLYHRVLKNSPYKWLDLKKLSILLLDPKHVIVDIKYFTAKMSGRFDPKQPIRQDTYIRALNKFIPEISVHYGRFQGHDVSMPRAPMTNPRKYVRVHRTEEKGSDVNLAVHLLNDAWRNKYECAVLISNDSDLAEPLRLVREQNSKTIGLFCPDPNKAPARDLRKHAHFIKNIRRGVLQNSQLPNVIPGTTITKPAKW